jgi:hypothetical protein
VAPPQPPLLAGLQTSELADQIEQIKVVPQVMSVEEISKIWSALQSQYRPTAVYKATVVLVESQSSVRPTLPVRARNLKVIPFERPVIDLLQSQENNVAPIVRDQPILAGYNLVIDGQRLRGVTTRIRIDALEILPNDTDVTAGRIVIVLPATLQPGLHSVQVTHPVDFETGLTSDPHRGIESNVAAFVLSPEITTPAPIAAARNTTLTLTIDPPVGRAQRATLLVGSGTISIPARPAAGPATTTTLDFPVPNDFTTGTQLLRVQIDGAESPLEVDGSGQFVGPTVTIT